MVIHNWPLIVSEDYEEIKYVKYCNKIFKTYNDKHKKCNDICIKAFQVFKMLIDTGDKLITPMELTDEVLNTQFMIKLMIINHYITMKQIAD